MNSDMTCINTPSSENEANDGNIMNQKTKNTKRISFLPITTFVAFR